MKRFSFLLIILSLVSVRITAQTNILDELEDMLGDDESFDSAVISIDREFYAFIDSINNDFARFLEKEWKSVPLGTVVKKKRDDEIKPIIRDEKEDKDKKDLIIRGTVIPIIKDERPQPKPIVPIKENKLTADYSTFSYYDTPMKVRWGEASQFKFANLSNKEIANAYRKLSTPAYRNLLHDCLALRKEYHLCDWAYYKLLETMAVAACGKGTNEAVFLQGVLYAQSGYTMRYAIDGKKKLHLLCRMTGGVYDCSPYTIDGKIFYLLDGTKPATLNYCPQGLKGEQAMSLEINEVPLLAKKLSDERTILSRNRTIEVKSRINKNLINFFNDYPTSWKDNNFMTRWAFYANTPVSDEIRNNVYPQLREKLKNLPPVTAVNLLLNWVQPLPEADANKPENRNISFPYGYDNAIWGKDRAFFAEETMYYPYSDCEDHAILFSHLVRDLLGLDVILVYYPQHLGAAVCFNTEVAGDAIEVNGRKFVVADPTSRGRVGTTMYQFRDTKRKDIEVILLNR